MDYAKNGQTSILAKITPRHFFRNPLVQIKDMDQKNKFYDYGGKMDPQQISLGFLVQHCLQRGF